MIMLATCSYPCLVPLLFGRVPPLFTSHFVFYVCNHGDGMGLHGHALYYLLSSWFLSFFDIEPSLYPY